MCFLNKRLAFIFAASIGLTAGNFSIAQSRKVSGENKKLAPVDRSDIQRWADAWNSHSVDVVMDLFTPDIIIHQPANPMPLASQSIRSFFGMIFQAYPDFHVEVTDSLVDGMKAVSIERVTGTWRGPYTDPATGKTAPGNGRKFDHPGIMVLTYDPTHRIKQVDIYWDRLLVNQQLGASPQ